jgi:hypothetical protein
MRCKATNIVCFTADSTPTAERGCICLSDGFMHCGSVNHWFTNNGIPTEWMPATIAGASETPSRLH